MNWETGEEYGYGWGGLAPDKEERKSRQPAPVPAAPDLAIAKEVHAAWRDGMLNQGRPVATDRMRWNTLHRLDHELDLYIAQRLEKFIVAEREQELTQLRQQVREAGERYTSTVRTKDEQLSVVRAEADQLRQQVAAYEKKLQKLSFAAGNVGIEHPEWPEGYSEHLTALVMENTQLQAEAAQLRHQVARQIVTIGEYQEKLRQTLICKNPLHALADGTPEAHEIGPSCMAKPAKEEAAQLRQALEGLLPMVYAYIDRIKRDGFPKEAIAEAEAKEEAVRKALGGE